MAERKVELNCCISLNEIWDFSSRDLRFILFSIRYDYNFIIIIHLLGVMNVLLTLSKSVSFLVASYIKLKKVFSLILSTNSTNSLLMNIYLEFFRSGYTTLKSHKPPSINNDTYVTQDPMNSQPNPSPGPPTT